MDNRKSTRPDDVPIIGDYSDAQNARLRPDAPVPPEAPAAPAAPGSSPPLRAPRPENRARDERWVLEASDLQRHARLQRQRERTRRVFRRARRYALVAIAIVVAGVVYWNFERLRGLTVEFSALTSLFRDDAAVAGGNAPRSGAGLESAPVEAPVVAGAAVPTDRSDTPVAPVVSGEPHAQEPPADKQAPEPIAEPARVPDQQLAAVAPPPAPPPEPETFAFGLPVNNVSESDAAASILILRSGDRRAASSVSWWTTPGTATAGSDYVDLGKVAVRFAPGEQNRTIHIPIIGDRVMEGPETFYVHLETSDGASPPVEQMPTQVVINDDD